MYTPDEEKGFGGLLSALSVPLAPRARAGLGAQRKGLPDFSDLALSSLAIYPEAPRRPLGASSLTATAGQ